MDARYVNKILTLNANNVYEKQLIDHVEFRRKIAFEEGVSQSGTSFRLDMAEDCLSFNYPKMPAAENCPWFDWVMPKKIFFVRRLLDCYLFENGCIPLHAAGIAYQGRLLLFFGDTNGGKSLISNALLNILEGSALVGDDHIVIDSPGKTGFGNPLARVKYFDDQRCTLNGSKYARYDSIASYLVDLGGSLHTKPFKGSVTKYLTDTFDHSIISFDYAAIVKSYQEAVDRILSETGLSDFSMLGYRQIIDRIVAGVK